MHKKQISHGSGEAVAAILMYALGGAGQAMSLTAHTACQAQIHHNNRCTCMHMNNCWPTNPAASEVKEVQHG